MDREGTRQILKSLLRPRIHDSDFDLKQEKKCCQVCKLLALFFAPVGYGSTNTLTLWSSSTRSFSQRSIRNFFVIQFSPSTSIPTPPTVPQFNPHLSPSRGWDARDLGFELQALECNVYHLASCPVHSRAPWRNSDSPLWTNSDSPLWRNSDSPRTLPIHLLNICPKCQTPPWPPGLPRRMAWPSSQEF